MFLVPAKISFSEALGAYACGGGKTKHAWQRRRHWERPAFSWYQRLQQSMRNTAIDQTYFAMYTSHHFTSDGRKDHEIVSVLRCRRRYFEYSEKCLVGVL